MPGTYRCVCIEGYEGTGDKDGGDCVNINECAKGMHDCHLNSEVSQRVGVLSSHENIFQCNDLDGTYECICDKGYEDVNGDGRECTLIDQCELQSQFSDRNGPCPEHSSCLPTAPGTGVQALKFYCLSGTVGTGSSNGPDIRDLR